MASFHENETESNPSETSERENNVVKPRDDKHVAAESFVVSGNQNDVNLQDAFMKYKKERQKELKKVRRKRKEIPDEARIRAMADPDRMWDLRMKFVEQAKKYFGVPYGKKYWKPEDPEYHSKLFLDCCGLVRRVMNDLKKDFGFKLGPWNQAYMCDTLPILVQKEEDMKPGDLVFISATYYNTRMKKQKHNMTHVEIWLGDGPKTIGSRWHKGKVQVFDSYRFKATSYHSETYIFKSIDTWLMGICRSHCPVHAWKTRAEKFKPTKKSIFRIPLEYDSPIDDNLGDEAAESAGDSSADDTATAETPSGQKSNQENKMAAKAPKPPAKTKKKLKPKKKVRKQDAITRACQERLEKLSIHGRAYKATEKHGDLQLNSEQQQQESLDETMQEMATNDDISTQIVESENSCLSDRDTENHGDDNTWRNLFVYDTSTIKVPVVDSSRESSQSELTSGEDRDPNQDDSDSNRPEASPTGNQESSSDLWDAHDTLSQEPPSSDLNHCLQNPAGGATRQVADQEDQPAEGVPVERVAISEGVYYLRQKKTQSLNAQH